MAVAVSGDTHTFHHAMADQFSGDDVQRKENDWSTGVHTLYGIKDEPGPQGGRTEVIGFEFDAGEFSVSEARDWLEEQGEGGATLVEEGTRENPSRTGYTLTALGVAGIFGFMCGMGASSDSNG